MSTGTETGQRRRRRLRLTPMPPVPVEFAGERAGEGPLTLGHLDVCAWVSRIPDHFYATLCVELPVPGVVSVDDVAEATGVLISRHEVLRTTYVPGEQPRQRVAAAGVQMLEVCSLGEGHWGPQDRPAVAEALIRWLHESPDPSSATSPACSAIPRDGWPHRPATSRWTRPNWRPRQPSGAGLRRHWTMCGSSRGGCPAACTPCRAPGPAASRWQ